MVGHKDAKKLFVGRILKFWRFYDCETCVLLGFSTISTAVIIQRCFWQLGGFDSFYLSLTFQLLWDFWQSTPLGQRCPCFAVFTIFPRFHIFRRFEDVSTILEILTVLTVFSHFLLFSVWILWTVFATFSTLFSIGSTISCAWFWPFWQFCPYFPVSDSSFGCRNIFRFSARPGNADIFKF